MVPKGPAAKETTSDMRTSFWVTTDRGFYFRVLGYGLSIQRDLPVSFSERYGHRRVLRIGAWAVEWLKRRGLPR